MSTELRDNVLGPFPGESHSPRLPPSSAWKLPYDFMFSHDLPQPTLALNSLICLSACSYSDYRCEPTHLNCRVMGMEPRASGTLGQHSNWIVQMHIFIGYALQGSFLKQDGPVENGETPPYRTATLKTCLRDFLGWKPTAQSLATPFDW